MFVPLHDGVPLRFMRTPWVTFGLIGACVGIHLALWSIGSPALDSVVLAGFGMIPSVLFGMAELAPAIAHPPAPLTMVSSIFLHAGFAHLIGNMLFLWVFGDNVEDAMGHWRFLAFFILCGIAGALGHALINPASEQPLIGASGAISGVIVAYLMLYPHVRIWGLVFKAIPLKVPAMLALGVWILFQAWQALTAQGGDVGWWAHLGGLAAGAALTPVMIHRGVALFGREVRRPGDA